MLNKEKAFEPIKKDQVGHVYLALTLDTRRPADELPVAVRINSNRQSMYYRTGMKVTLEDYQKIVKARIRGANFDIQQEQVKIFDVVSKIVRELVSANKFSFDELKSKLTGNEASTFNEYWRQFAQTKKIGTQTAYLSALISFEKYVGLRIAFSRMGISLIDKWKNGLKKDDISNTTLGFFFRAARAVINDAIKNGKLNKNQYPFGKGKVEIKKGRHRTEQFLTVKEIKKLVSFRAPEGHWHRSYEEIVYQAINLWLFSYLGNGLNMADIAQLKYDDHYFYSDGTEFRFIRQKTADTTDEDVEVIIPVIPKLRAIVDQYGAKSEPGAYVFPQILNGETNPVLIKKIVSQWNSNVQDRVIAACKLIGINNKPVSMTWARHSYATNLTLAGVSERYISQAMGHSIKSVTQGYIGLFPPEKRKEFNEKLLKE